LTQGNALASPEHRLGDQSHRSGTHRRIL